MAHPMTKRPSPPWQGLAGPLAATALAVCLAACGGGLLPAQNAQSATRFTSYDEVVDAYDQVQPYRTTEADLPRFGFDARTGNVDVLSYVDIQRRFLPHAGMPYGELDPAVRACIHAQADCVGYVFHPEHSGTKRIGNTVADVLGFERVTRSEHWSAEVVLLVQNGRVVHKVFSGSPRTENVEDKVQPLGPLQDVGAALARAVGASSSF
jgi:hypothetical protein